MTTLPPYHSGFNSAVLFALNGQGNPLLLQVNSDYDIARRSLDIMFGKSRPMQMHGIQALCPDGDVRYWSIESQAHYDLVLKNFFRPFKDPGQINNKPHVYQLVLMPIALDKPIVPNDFGDL